MGIATFYYIGIGLTGLGALFLLQTRKELHAILGFLWITVGLSMVFFLQGASFIAAMQISLQGGSVLVWLLTSLWFKQTPQQPVSQPPRILLGVFLGVVGIGIAGLVYYGTRHATLLSRSTSTYRLADIPTVGLELLSTQGIAFEWAGLMVLFALILVVDAIANLKK